MRVVMVDLVDRLHIILRRFRGNRASGIGIAIKTQGSIHRQPICPTTSALMATDGVTAASASQWLAAAKYVTVFSCYIRGCRRDL
jgi:hypothetical protein